jgi:HAD superfamily hydrolase (TIGR01509 family)
MNRCIFLFDLDDTLVGTGGVAWVACLELLNGFLECKGVQEKYSTEYLRRNCIGIPLDDFMRAQAQKHGFAVSEKELANIMAEAEPIIIDHFWQNLKPVEPVRQALSKLRAQNHDIGIVTSSSKNWIDACITATEISEFIDHRLIFSARSLAVNVKPDPAVYTHALSQLPAGIPIIAVEDSTAGIKSAVAAKVPVILGCVAFSPPDMRQQQAAALRALGAKTVFDNWDAFLTVADEELVMPMC